jgi:uncharacterized membrane protein
MKILKKLVSPFGRGSFWVIGFSGSILWMFIYWLVSLVGPFPFTGESVAGSFLGAFGFSYVASLIVYKNN